MPARLRPGASQITRLTAAAVFSYLVANAYAPGILDLTAPLTALLVVQASTVGTLRMGLVRVGAVLTGVLVAVGVAAWLGLSWWSLGAVIAASLVLANVLRLGDQSLEALISAMLILAVSSPEVAAEVRGREHPDRHGGRLSNALRAFGDLINAEYGRHLDDVDLGTAL